MGKTSKGGSGKTHFSAPYEGVRVHTAAPKGNELTCSFTARKMAGIKGSLSLSVDKVTKTFQCESPEHAQALAEHAKKLHARKHRNSLIYSLTKLSEGITYVDGSNISGLEILRKAQERAAKKYKNRQKAKTEREKRKRLEDERRVKMERK